MSEARKRLEALATDLERLDPWGGTRSQSDAADLREILAESDRLSALVGEAEKVVGRLADECSAEFTVDGKWYDDGQLVSEAAYRAARSLLTRLKGEA